MAEEMHRKKYIRGAVVYSEGQPVKHVYFVLEGEFCLEKALPKNGQD